MITSLVHLATKLSCLPNGNLDSHPVIEVITKLPGGTPNSFYMEITDVNKDPISIASELPPVTTPDPQVMNEGDPIQFDVPDGLFHKCVIWKSRKIRQVQSSFDTYSKEAAGGYTGYDFLQR